MTQYPKRLIEVDLPIKRISAHARREKSIRHGHISTLHIWWARRPLAACRAVICASLWPDPADPLCPPSFKEKARSLMQEWAIKHLELVGTESYSRFVRIQKESERLDDDEELRGALLDFIADFANWDNSTNETYLKTSRTLTQTAHEALGGIPGTKPLVVDPFAGGGSIPLEALRVGADAFASDLNPVAVLLNKVVLEYIPKYGKKLAAEVRKWGEWVKKEAEKELSEFYPKDPDGSTPIAYLWARTITCEGPGCGAVIPLIRSLLLAKRGNNSIGLKIVPDRVEKKISFEIQKNIKAKDIGEGTLRRGAVTCPICEYTTPVASVRSQLKSRLGGVKDARLIAVCIQSIDKSSRYYRLPTDSDEIAVINASKEWNERLDEGSYISCPDEELPLMSGVFNVPLYGHLTWGSLFNTRKLLTLTTLARIVRDLTDSKFSSTIPLDVIKTFLAIAVDRQSDYSSAICTWVSSGEFIGHTFAQGQSLPIKFDFAEVAPFAKCSGNWDGAISWIVRVCERCADANYTEGIAINASATSHPAPDESTALVATDPPYYNAIPYADLSDFFYVWLKRVLKDIHPNLFSEAVTPKKDEICEMAGWDPIRYAHKDKMFFELKMTKAMNEAQRIVSPNGLGLIVFAHKETSGWEAQLQAMVDSGWVITGSWPVDTEMGARLRARNSAALASSIHIVCRPRRKTFGLANGKDIGDWRDVLQELPKRIHAWMPRLAADGVVGADAIFACLGPALEIFSRYNRVEKASGEEVTLREYLEHVWAAVAREALSMIFEGADATGFEEDARLTAMWLWTLYAGRSGNGNVKDKADEDDGSAKKQGGAGYGLEYDAARKIAQGLGAHLEKLTATIEVKGDQARLLSVAERTRFLFGKEDSAAPARQKKKQDQQMNLLEMLEDGEAETGDVGWGEKSAPDAGKTILDRLHQSMILFAAGRGEALKRFLVEEGVGQDLRFWSLAQALSALYPPGSDEKRWVDGVLARKKSLGF